MSICHPLYPLCPLSFWSAADVMNDTCDKVPSVCTRHEILSNAFRMLYIGYVCISMDSIVLFAKLCAVLLLSNVSPPAYVSLILVRHADFKPQPLFLPSLNHSSINFIPTPISDCPVSLLLVQFTWSHRISVLDHGTFICSYTRQRLKKKVRKILHYFSSYERVYIRNILHHLLLVPFLPFLLFLLFPLFMFIIHVHYHHLNLFLVYHKTMNRYEYVCCAPV